MRVSTQEKEEIIRLVDRSELGVNKTLRELGIHKSTFYNWYRAYLQKGSKGLLPVHNIRRQWNTIPEEQKQVVVEVSLNHPELSPRELAVKITDEQRVFISESSVYRILKAQGSLPRLRTSCSPHQMSSPISLALCTSCGRLTSRTSKCWAGAGII